MLTRRIFGIRIAPLMGGAIAGLLAVTPAALAANTVTVFAAASLKNALDDVNHAWKADTGKEARISYAASSALAKQIEAGAPADLFVSADLDWMKYLSDKELTQNRTEVRLLGNKLVLIAPKASAKPVKVTAHLDLAGLLKGGHLAMANTDAVPAGKYGKAALEKLGIWTSVEGRIAQAENVRAALKLVATGEAPYGIVYQTDAHAEPSVTIVGEFPEGSYPPIIYPAGLIAGSKNPDAAAFLKYMQTAKAKALFEKQGFTFLPAAASN
ncbi:MAG: molybdate ABC transporter substrate-binding protein [Rhizobiaceae bacterium]